MTKEADRYTGKIAVGAAVMVGGSFLILGVERAGPFAIIALVRGSIILSIVVWLRARANARHLLHLETMERLNRWVLLDREGVFAQAYGFEKKSCNLLAFFSGGVLLLRRAVKEVNARTREEVLRALAAE